jgi:hypothetical protein
MVGSVVSLGESRPREPHVFHATCPLAGCLPSSVEFARMHASMLQMSSPCAAWYSNFLYFGTTHTAWKVAWSFGATQKSRKAENAKEEVNIKSVCLPRSSQDLKT